MLADEKKQADELKGAMFFHMIKLALAEQEQDTQEIIKSTSQTKKIYKNGRILILDGKVHETNLVLVNLYNPSIKPKQLATLLDLDKKLETIKDFYDKHIYFNGSFNFFS